MADQTHFKCTQCEKVYKTKSSWCRHVKSMHTSDGVGFKCKKCGAVFGKIGMHIHHEGTCSGLQCANCGITFRRVEYLKQHVDTCELEPSVEMNIEEQVTDQEPSGDLPMECETTISSVLTVISFITHISTSPF